MTSPHVPPPFRILIDRDQILRRTRELVREVQAQLGSDQPPCLVAVIEGARPFARIVQQLLPGALMVREVRAKSYQGTTSTGDVTVTMMPGLDAGTVAGQDVILLEDIVDTGRTIQKLREHFAELGARSVRVLTMLSKPSRRVVDVAVEHIGFEIPDEFVIGFGMDLDGRYRELEDVVVYDAEVERTAANS
ncbi:MAG: phosphoribosyltransferase [Planctomycetota bacterium]